MTEKITTKSLGGYLQEYFCHRLVQQQQVSHQTVTSYRDTFRLLLRFAEQTLGKTVSEIALSDLDAPLVLAFLDHLESKRKNSIRSRNARLAAVRSFLHYAGLQEPTALAMIQKVFAIPMKRFDRPVINFLHLEEIETILDAPDQSTWSGRRDKTLLITMYNTGARVSEIVHIRCSDIDNAQCSAISLHGKGRKHRVIPLWKRTSRSICNWLPQIIQSPQNPLFPNRHGKQMTRSGVAKQLQSAVSIARKRIPTLANKNVSPHTIRHTTAMHLLQAGVDLSVIALWLGHENINTTHHYMQADIQMKRKALSKMDAPGVAVARFKPSRNVLSFLDSL